MIDNEAVEHMARAYQINPSLARRLLERSDTQPAPALQRCREYQGAVDMVEGKRR